MQSTKKDIEPKEEFPGSAGKGSLPASETVKVKEEFTGSAAKGMTLPKQKQQGK